MSAWWLGLHGLPEDVIGGDFADADDEVLRLRIAGREWELESTHGDPVTLVDAEGMSTYADLDGDGEVDHISTVHTAGGFEVWSADPHVADWGLPGGWSGQHDAGADPAGWGLPEGPTPENGGGGRGGAQNPAAWRCVDRG